MMNFPLSRRFSYEKRPGRSRGARITEKRFSLSLNQPRFHQKRTKGGEQGIEQNCLEGQTDQVFDGAAHPLTAFLHGGIRQAYDGKGGQPARNVGLHGHGKAAQAVQANSS